MATSHLFDLLTNPEIVRDVLTTLTAEKLSHPSRQILLALELKKKALISELNTTVDQYKKEELTKQLGKVEDDILDTNVTLRILDVSDSNKRSEQIDQYNRYINLKKKVTEKHNYLINLNILKNKTPPLVSREEWLEKKINSAYKNHALAVDELIAFKIQLIENSTLVKTIHNYTKLIENVTKARKKLATAQDKSTVEREIEDYEIEITKFTKKLNINTKRLLESIVSTGYQFIKDQELKNKIKNYREAAEVLTTAKQQKINATRETIDSASSNVTTAEKLYKQAVDAFSMDETMFNALTQNLEFGILFTTMFSMRDIEIEKVDNQDLKNLFINFPSSLRERKGLNIYDMIKELKKEPQSEERDRKLVELEYKYRKNNERYTNVLLNMWKDIDNRLQNFYVGYNLFDEIQRNIKEVEEQLNIKSETDKILKVTSLQAPQEISDLKDFHTLLCRNITVTRSDFIAFTATSFLASQERDTAEVFWDYFSKVQSEMERKGHKIEKKDLKLLYETFKREMKRLSGEYQTAYQEAAEISMKVSALDEEDKLLTN
jgi:hypothetical protein